MSEYTGDAQDHPDWPVFVEFATTELGHDMLEDQLLSWPTWLAGFEHGYDEGYENGCRDSP